MTFFLCDARTRGAAVCTLAALVAGCTGRAGVVPPATPANSVTSGAQRQSVQLVIKVPSRSSASALRRAAYVSPATQSITVAITGTATQTVTANLTPTSSGCTSTLATTTCTLALSLAPGTYTATVSTFDGTNGTGSVLSAGQAVNFAVVAGQANMISLTLNGIPHALVVAAQGAAARTTDPTDVVLSGIFPVPLLALALDADGDVIVGPGSPTFTVSHTGGTNYTIANPTTTTPNTFELTPASSATAGTFTLTAAYSDGTCSQSGAVCTVSFNVTTHLQPLMVENDTNVKVYAPPYTSTPVTLSGYAGTAGLAGIGAFDASGNLFVSDNSAQDLLEYTPPYTGSPVSVAHGTVSDPIGVVVAPSGLVFIASFTSNAVDVYASPYTSGTPSVTVTNGVNGPDMLALDANADLFVSNFRGGNVTEYAPPYTGAPVATMSGVSNPLQIALDGAGDLFALPVSGAAVYAFAPPYTGGATTITAGMNSAAAIATGPGNALFVGQDGTNRVDRYLSPYSSVATSISNGVSQPQALAFDAAGDLFVANANAVTIYAPPYTGTPVTVTNGVSAPEGLALGQ